MSDHLFSPLTLRGVTLRNRIAVSPMCMYSCDDGAANDWHFVHLGSRAVGGAGLVIAEATGVEARGRISPQDLGLWKDEQIEPLKRVTGFIREHGAAAGIQLAHAGRKGSTHRPWDDAKVAEVPAGAGGWQTVAPSAISFTEGYPMPVELTVEEIAGIAKAWAESAGRALEAGFDVVEVHGAHGYLVHQFLSPISNKRTDQYGGSFENRTWFLREVVTEVRKVWPERLPLFVRLSATDWAESGVESWDVEQTVELSKALGQMGVDLVDCSSGGNLATAKIPIGAGYQTEFAAKVKAEAGIATGAVGMITSSAQADTIIRTGQADIVLLARELLRDPYWPMKAAKELHKPVPAAVQYARAW